MKNVLLRGEIVRQTVGGHYNFQYPSVAWIMLKEPTFVEILPWISFDSFIPVMIKNQNSLPENYKKSIVWVSKNSIHKE